MTTGPAIPFDTNSRYPDPRIEVLDERFLKLRLFSSSVEQLASGLRWAEGPQWFGDGRYLLVSDIPNNRILRWDDASGQVSEFRKPSHNANGLARDMQGRLLTCEHQARRITRTEYNGSITVLADHFEGKRLNSPNDIICQRNGAVWFTDPGYGIDGPYEGHAAEAELPRNVYRLDATTGRATVVAGDFVRPNGIGFSPDEKKLYVVDSGISHGGPAHIRVFDVDGSELRNGRVFADDFRPGMTDGLRCDTDGNVWCSMGWGDPKEDGVRCYAPNGDLIGKIHLPEGCANVCFGGRKKDRLFMCASTSVYALYVNGKGAMVP